MYGCQFLCAGRRGSGASVELYFQLPEAWAAGLGCHANSTWAANPAICGWGCTVRKGRSVGVGTGWDPLSKPSIDVGHLLRCICWQSDSAVAEAVHAFWFLRWRLRGETKRKGERGCSLLCARTLVASQTFILTLALASLTPYCLINLYVEDPGLCALSGVAVGWKGWFSGHSWGKGWLGCFA